MRKPAFCICKNKDADQLRGNREADQHFCLLPKYKISNKNTIMSSFNSSGDIQKKEGGPDSCFE